jgi:hypothetical protein
VNNDIFLYELDKLLNNSYNFYKYFSSRIYYNEPNKIYVKSVDLFYDTLDTILELFDIEDINE